MHIRILTLTFASANASLAQLVEHDTLNVGVQHKCGYRKQWSEEKINNAVEEVIRKLVKNPKFEEAILNKIASRIDTEEIEKEIEGLEKQHRQLTGAKARLGQQMDSLDIMDKFYEKKYQDGVLGYVPVYEKWAFYCYFEKLRGVSGRANC